MDLQADSLAFHVLEFHEGILGDIDCMLEDVKKISSAKTFDQTLGAGGTYVIALARSDVHHS